MGTNEDEAENREPERSVASTGTKKSPTGQRLVTTVNKLKKHPIWVLLGMVIAVILVMGQLADSIPSIGKVLSGIVSPFLEREPRQDLAYASSAGILLKVPGAPPRLLAPVADTESVVELRWSENGKQLAALIARQEPGDEWPSLEDRRIWYVDLLKNEEGSWPCRDCGSIAFTGNKVLSLSDGDGIRLRVFSLDDLPTSPAFSGPDWGIKQRQEDVASILGGGPAGLLFAIADPAGVSAQGGPQLIYRTDSAGHTSFLGKTGSYVGVEGGVTRTGGREIAVVYTVHGSACDNVDHVAVINLTNNSRRELSEPETIKGWRINSVDWSAEGDLVSVRYEISRSCSALASDPHIARWDGRAWQRIEDTEGSVVVAAGNDGALGALRQTKAAETLQLHVLYPGERDWTVIAEEAESIAWRPPS